MALQSRESIPAAVREAFVIVETGCRPTLGELDSMPQKLVDGILLYRAVKNIIEQGGDMRL